MKQVTILVPVYNEAENLEPFLEETAQVLNQSFLFTYLFVNDGSSDATLPKLRKLSMERKDIRYLSFSRNFGKEAAIYAGLQHAKGDYVILMDGDLQHPPRLIPEMLRAVCEEGFQAAGAKRKPGFFSRMFTGINNKVSSVKLEKGATDYMCMSRKFVDAVLQLSESQRFSKGLFAWVGFDVKWLTYEQEPRRSGKSKWSSAGLFSYAADGITSFSILPLKLVTIAGAIICVLAFIYILITLIKTLVLGIDVPGYVTTLCMILFMGGVIMLAIGILGAYIGRIYLESKDRPMYILQEESPERLPGRRRKSKPGPEYTFGKKQDRKGEPGPENPDGKKGNRSGETGSEYTFGKKQDRKGEPDLGNSAGKKQDGNREPDLGNSAGKKQDGNRKVDPEYPAEKKRDRKEKPGAENTAEYSAGYPTGKNQDGNREPDLDNSAGKKQDGNRKVDPEYPAEMKRDRKEKPGAENTAEYSAGYPTGKNQDGNRKSDLGNSAGKKQDGNREPDLDNPAGKKQARKAEERK